jgi:hypothetical protein
MSSVISLGGRHAAVGSAVGFDSRPGTVDSALCTAGAARTLSTAMVEVNAAVADAVRRELRSPGSVLADEQVRLVLAERAAYDFDAPTGAATPPPAGLSVVKSVRSTADAGQVAPWWSSFGSGHEVAPRRWISLPWHRNPAATAR